MLHDLRTPGNLDLGVFSNVEAILKHAKELVDFERLGVQIGASLGSPPPIPGVASAVGRVIPPPPLPPAPSSPLGSPTRQVPIGYLLDGIAAVESPSSSSNRRDSAHSLHLVGTMSSSLGHGSWKDQQSDETEQSSTSQEDQCWSPNATPSGRATMESDSETGEPGRKASTSRSSSVDGSSGKAHF
ncbi:hypothetical protein TCAL_04897 [Tigriopus californicus]|uniref:Uncharacterized protein n=1 Tax=Tigriopus californicus TaxID=6832 RepID=A0A553NDL1_TIGCA|nr:hypothetical protein TCAL_04897 [Tigriopus californicus]|eukprot:TCALIF_04897-PA protein Name:"Protein of unknown function" AED:0.66 eAED:0.71 QI:0/0.5/0/0.66/0.5/0.66/3/0/185